LKRIAPGFAALAILLAAVGRQSTARQVRTVTVTYQYRLHAPAGQRVVAGSIALHGHPIAATDQVRVAATDFLFSGGGGLTVLREGTGRPIGCHRSCPVLTSDS
jgi:5'-nucleotidase, C-terminal domain